MSPPAAAGSASGPDGPHAVPPPDEDPDYLSRQLITCIGNKRALLGPIAQAVDRVRARLGGRRLHVLDAFSGSGVVSRALKAHADRLVSNDLEGYAAAIGACFLRNRSETDLAEVQHLARALNEQVHREGQELAAAGAAPPSGAPGTPPAGFLQELYAPADEAAITRDDRVFYTRENARRLDRYRQLLAELPAEPRSLLMGPLLGKASVHTNTAGVFKGFYKDRRTGLGRFGGSGADALQRIRGTIQLEAPVLSRFEAAVEVRQQDANQVARELRDLDLAYVDPPYNQHPYGSNYFMLNLLLHYRRPTKVSPVSGIPHDWRRSGYNVRTESLPLLRDLLEHLDARFILLSFNDEGFVPPEEMRALLDRLGRVEVFETVINAFRGSRNFDRRPLHVTERLYLVERR